MVLQGDDSEMQRADATALTDGTGWLLLSRCVVLVVRMPL
jgi:hypothetical protein